MFRIIILLKQVIIKARIELIILNIHIINGHQIEKIKKKRIKKKLLNRYQAEKKKKLKI